jgi:L-fuconolactonase
MRVDTHQHFWRYDPVRDAWIDARMPVLQRDFLPEHVAPLLAATGIDAVVAVQADQSEAETDFLLALAAAHPVIRGVVGWTDLGAPDLAESLVRRRRDPRLKGFRHIAQAEPDDFLRRPDVIAGIAQLGAHDFTYDILIHAHQLPAATHLVERCEGVRFVLDHCAKPPIASGQLEQWQQDLAVLARHDNVSCKLSGLVTEAHWTRWTDAQVTACLDVAAEAFGAHRLMFGSDWPVCLLAAEYARVVQVVDDWMQRLTSRERAAICGDTAVAVYRLETE